MSHIDKEKQWKLYNKMMNSACGKEEAELIRQKLISLNFKPEGQKNINDFSAKESFYQRQIDELKTELSKTALDNIKYISENGILKLEISNLKSNKFGDTYICIVAVLILILTIGNFII